MLPKTLEVADVSKLASNFGCSRLALEMMTGLICSDILISRWPMMLMMFG